MRVFLGGFVLVLLLQSAWAEYWYEDFDRFPAGPIARQSGWSSTGTAGSETPPRVSELGHWSSPHALLLSPVPIDESAKVAVYDALQYSGTGVVRISFKLWRRNNDQYFEVHLAQGNISRMNINTALDGTITVNSTATSGHFVTDRYATYTLFYNLATRRAQMTLDGVQILPWTDLGLSSFTSFDRISFHRSAMTPGNDTGNIFVDDVSVQTLPPETLAWWRFEEGTGDKATEETGTFLEGTYELYSGTGWAPAPSALAAMFNGFDAVRNRHARLNTNLATLAPNAVTGTIDWSLELIVRLDGFSNCTFFEWASTFPPDTTNGTWIKLEWASGGQTLGVRLRCDGQPAATQVFESFSGLPRDGQWHHIALVKYGGQLSAYADYQLLGARTLTVFASGNYTFGTSSRAYIGQDHSGGDRARGGIGFDEIRFSGSFDPVEFLRVDQPFFTAPPMVNALTADLTFVGTPWLQSEIFRKSDLQPGSWTSCGRFVTPAGYIGQEQTVNVPKPSTAKGFYSIE